MKHIIILTMMLGAVLTIGSCTSPKTTKKENASKNVITFQFELKNGAQNSLAKDAKLYVPYPLSEDSQDISDVKINGNFNTTEIRKDERTGATFLYAVWESPSETPKLTFEFSVDSHFKKGPALKDGGNTIPADITPYLQPSQYMPCDDSQILMLAKEATGNASTILEKARAIYEWTIKNTFRNPAVVGCGLGDVLVTLNENEGGGKCADISPVFVALLRASGVPAREVYGLRITGEDGEITGDFHCWVEFYLPGTGWIQADPADVRKAMLVNNLELDDPATKEWTEFFWNGDNLFRIVLSRADYGVLLDPNQNGIALEYFMYPFAVLDGEPLNYFDYKSFAYSVLFKAANS